MLPFAPNLEFIRSLDEGGDFTIGYVAVIPSSRGRLFSYGKLSGYIDVQRRRKIGGLRNVRARRDDIEGGWRFRQSDLPCQSEIAIKKNLGRDRVDVDDADVLQTLNLWIFPIALKDVARRRDDDWDVVFELKIVPAQMMLANVVIDLDQVLVGILNRGSAIVLQIIGPVRRVIRKRDVIQQIESRWVKGCRINHIVAVELVGRGRVGVRQYCTRKKSREISVTLSLRRHLGTQAVVGRVLACALIRSKEKQLAFQDWPADGASKLILLQRVWRGGKIVLGIHRIVAKILKSVAMKLIGSGLGYDIGHSARRVSISGAHVIGLHIEFLQRVRTWERQIGVDIHVVVVHAIQQVIDAVGTAAIDFRILLARQNATFTIVAAVLSCDIDRAGDQKDQLLRLASIQGHAFHALLIDNLRDGCIVGGHLVGTALHRDLLGHRSDRQGDLLAGGLPDFQTDALLHIGPEAGHFNCHLIVANWEAWKQVLACTPRFDDLLVAGSCLFDGHSRPRNRCTRVVLYRAAQPRRGELGNCRRCPQNDHEERCEKKSCLAPCLIEDLAFHIHAFFRCSHLRCPPLH